MITLGGCGVSKTPSASDVKSQLQDAFKGCSVMQITQLEKTNGFDQGNGHYLVNVKFTVKTTPLPEVMKALDASKARREELKPQMDSYIGPAEARIEALKEERKVLSDKLHKEADEHETQVRATARQIHERLASEGKKNTNQDPEILALEKEYNKDHGKIFDNYEKLIEANEAEQKSIHEKIYTLKDEFNSLDFNKNEYPYPDREPMNPKTLRGKMVLAHAKTCMLPSASLISDIKSKIYQNMVPYVENTETEFTADIPMLKTDNGWIIQQLYK